MRDCGFSVELDLEDEPSLSIFPRNQFNLEDGGFAVYGSVEWIHENGFGLHVRVVTARDFALSTGLVLELDTLFGGHYA